jgi:hypothetical protein
MNLYIVEKTTPLIANKGDKIQIASRQCSSFDKAQRKALADLGETLDPGTLNYFQLASPAKIASAAIISEFHARYGRLTTCRIITHAVGMRMRRRGAKAMRSLNV